MTNISCMKAWGEHTPQVFLCSPNSFRALYLSMFKGLFYSNSTDSPSVEGHTYIPPIIRPEFSGAVFHNFTLMPYEEALGGIFSRLINILLI